MLTKIREKAQGIFSWVILILICVPFTLWGIQNYLNVGQEQPVVTVGDKEFLQRDVNMAYQQYSQQFAGQKFNEERLKQQALDKLVRDEVLLQFVEGEGLVVTDQTVREFILSLPYFQTDEKYDKVKYQSLLTSQGLSSGQFVARVRKALIMEQFQRSIIDSSFTTEYDLDKFFKIQNQFRSVEFVKVAVEKQQHPPTEAEINDYYQKNQDNYKTDEQVSVEYIDLSLDELAKNEEPSEAQLVALYEEQKDIYTIKGRRKISHILFKFDADSEQDKLALDKAKHAAKRLEKEDFEALAKELSEDKLTATNGGDLGLFIEGVMEPAFEQAARSLKMGEISEPVKSAFGYHLIKVTELIPSVVKPFDKVKEDVKKAFQKTAAENTFYELGETLTELSYENAEDLTVASDAMGISISKTGLFSRDKGVGIAAELEVRNEAFSEDVLKGNNSAPIELGTDRLIVLRILEHHPAAIRELKEVSQEIVSTLLAQKARKIAFEKATEIKKLLLAGQSMQSVADNNKLKVEKFVDLTRRKSSMPRQVTQAVFKAAKPGNGVPTISMVELSKGEQVVFSLLNVKEGELIAEDIKEQQELAKTNIAKAFGQSLFSSVISSLQSKADIVFSKSQ